MNKSKLEAAIAYFEDAVRESDEIIADCTPDLQAELTEQKGHFVVALEAMRTPLPENKALTVEELREMDEQPVWCEELQCHGLVSVENGGKWAGIPFLVGRLRQVDIEYDIQRRGLTLYHRPQRRIDMDFSKFMKDNTMAENAWLKEELEKQTAFLKNEIHHKDCQIERMEAELADALRRIAEDNKAREEGLLMRLPCKRGDTVYFIKSAFSMAAFPIEAKITSIRGIDCDGAVMYKAVTNYNNLDRCFTSENIGKTVFLTRAEAAAALGGGEGD